MGLLALKPVVSVAFVFGILAIFVVILNAWIGISIVWTRVWIRHKFFLFLILLALADFFIGVSYLSFWIFIWMFYNDERSKMYSIECYTLLLVMIIGTLLQELVTFAISLERLLATSAPFFYRKHGNLMSIGVLVLCILIAFAIGLSGYAALVPQAGVHFCALSTVVTVAFLNFYQKLRIALFLAAILCYICVLIAMRRLNESMAPTAELERRARKQARLTKMVVVLVGVYALTTGTAIAIGLVIVHANIDAQQRFLLMELTALFHCLNCFLNVFIFPLKAEEIRVAVKAQLNRLACGRLQAFAPTESEMRPIASSTVNPHAACAQRDEDRRRSSNMTTKLSCSQDDQI